MSFTSGFFDSKLVDGAYDRAYYAAQFAEYFSTFIKNGVFPDPATNLQVSANSPNDMTVLVSSGFGWINGYYCKNDDDYPLIIGIADGALPRIDAIVLRWNRVSREITLAVKPGSTSITPQTPSLDRSADVYELMLASIYVSAGVTSIGQKDITDTRPNNELCGWVSGTVEQIDTTNLFAQYDDAFNRWFEALKAQLTGNIATNLQNQITDLKTKEESSGVYYTPGLPYTQLQDYEGNKLRTPEGWQVGDVLNTVRTDLGPSWLLCNGEGVLPIEYPKLCELMAHNWTFNTEIYEKTDLATGDEASSSISNLFHVNNRWVIMYTDADSRLHVSIQSEDGPWNSHLVSGLSISSASEIRIRWLDGRYILFTTSTYVTHNSKSVTLYESVDLINWTSLVIPITPFETASTQYLREILESSNGTFMMVTQRTASSYYATYGISSSLTGPFVFPATGNTMILSSSTTRVRSSYAEGKFFITCVRSSGYLNVYVYDINSSSGTLKTIDTEKGFTPSPVQYIDGIYVLVGGDQMLYLSYDGYTWEETALTHNTWSNWSSVLMGKIQYKGKTQLISWRWMNASASTYSGSITVDIVDLQTRSITNIISDLNMPLYWDGTRNFFLTESGLKVSFYDETEDILSILDYSTYDLVKLPTISVDSVYTYIRALEE